MGTGDALFLVAETWNVKMKLRAHWGDFGTTFVWDASKVRCYMIAYLLRSIFKSASYLSVCISKS